MQLPDRPWNGLTILDAYSCAGGATMGYYLAGYRVVAVDIQDQPNHPGRLYDTEEIRFVRADAVEYIRDYGTAFHLIHASPPCQYDCTLTAGTNAHLRGQYADLLEPTREALESTGRPYVIEQPPGRASRRMRVDLTLCGEQFGLDVIRHRNFEGGGGLVLDQPPHVPHRGRVAGMRHGVWYEGPYFAVYGEGGGKGTVQQWQQAMGIHWTSVRREIAEAIPPAYTQMIGQQAAQHLAAATAGARRSRRVSFYMIPIVHCDGPDCEAPETHHAAASTVTEVRAIRKADGWHQRPGGRDICPGCWVAGHR